MGSTAQDTKVHTSVLRRAASDTAAFVQGARFWALELIVGGGLALLAQLWNPLELEGRRLVAFEAGLPLGGIVTCAVVSFVVLLVVSSTNVEIQLATVQHHDALNEQRDARMKEWLCKRLNKPWISCAIAFGSVVGRQETRDVDLIIVFEEDRRWRLKRRAKEVGRVAREFKAVFGLGLHRQFFLSTEQVALRQFLDVAGAHEVLVARSNDGA